MLAGHQMAETDPELGANLMVFFIRDWAELPQVPKLDHLVPGLSDLCARLSREGAHHYRLFRFDADGAIKAAFVFVRMDAALQNLPAEAVALNEAVLAMLLWSEAAFAGSSALARVGGAVVLRPDVADVVRASYDKAMPVAARDVSHALRLAARLG